MMLEKTFREAVDRSGQDPILATLPPDYEALRLSESEAKSMLETYRREVTEERRRAEVEAEELAEEERLRQELLAKVKAEEAAAPPPPQAPASPDVTPLDLTSGTPTADTDSSGAEGQGMECSNCGYTIYPAAGREWKFFGEDFVCPQCGAPKSKFRPAVDDGMDDGPQTA